MKHNSKCKTKGKTLSRRIRIFFRRHIFNKRAAEGSITIFLIIIMLPMLIFSCSVIDLCKIFMARNSTDGALQLTMNSRLASYDDILKDMYGILASSADEDDLAKNLTNYYKMTLESSTGSTLSSDEEKYVENFFSSIFGTDTSALDEAVKGTNGLLNLYENDDEEFSVTPIVTSSVSNPEVMHKQIVEYMKYRGPVYLTTGVLDKIMAFSDISNQATAAESQIEYEKQLDKTGDSFKETYNTLSEFLEESNKFENISPFSEFYDNNGKVQPMSFGDDNDVVDSLADAYICAFFGSAFDKNGKLSFEEDVENAFDAGYSSSKNISDAADELTSALGGIELDAENAYKIFNTSDSASEFIEKNANSDAVNLLNNKFGALFEGVSKTGNDDVISLLEAYNDARAYSNYLDKELAKNNTETRAETLNREKNEIDTAISEAESTINSIKNAAGAIKSFMERLYSEANKKFSQSAAKLSSAYETIKAQLDRLNLLLGSNGIDKIVKDLEETGRLAGEYKTAIDNVKTESEKSNMTSVYNSGAAKIKEISLDTQAINDLKSILEELRGAYTAAKNTIESIQYLKDTGIENSIVKNNAVIIDFTVFLKKFCDGHKGDSEWYSYSGYKYSKYFSCTSESCTNLKQWNSKNGEIMNNEFYDVVVKYGKEKEALNEDAKTSAEEAKGKIDTLGKTMGDANDSKNVKENESQNDNSDDDESNWFVPQYYPTYSGYIQDLHNAYKTDKDSDDNLKILDEDSFSYEKSDDEKTSADDIGSTSFGKDASGVTDLLGSIGTFFENLLSATRDKFYIAEYLTENFPCVTTLQDDKDAQMISGESFYDSKNGKPNVVCSQSSLEYILYGNVQGGKAEAALSVAKAGAVVFAVRFALNLIYALTSSSLALEIEPMVAAVECIPFAAPLARTVILIGLALGESGIDLALLMANQDVALFKSESTWICSPSGVINGGIDALKDLALDKAPDLIDKVSVIIKDELTEAEDNLAAKLMEGTNEIETEVNKYTEETLNSIKAEIESNVWTPIVSLIRSYIDDFDPEYNVLTVDIISDQLDNAINSAEENLALNDASVEAVFVKEIEKEIFQEIRSQKSVIANSIYNNIEEFYNIAKSGMLNGIDALENKVKECLSSVKNKIQSYFEENTDRLKGKVKEAITETVKELKDSTTDTVDSISEKLKSGLNEKLRGMKSSTQNLDLSKESSSESSKGLLADKEGENKEKDNSIKVSYKDYLYVFTVLGLIINEDNMLMRAAQLMSANIEYKVFGSTRSARPKNAYNSEVSYDLNKAYTLFKGEAGSKTRTMFFGTTWNKDDQQWVRPASNVYSYKATTFVGY